MTFPKPAEWELLADDLHNLNTLHRKWVCTAVGKVPEHVENRGKAENPYKHLCIAPTHTVVTVSAFAPACLDDSYILVFLSLSFKCAIINVLLKNIIVKH